MRIVLPSSPVSLFCEAKVNVFHLIDLSPKRVILRASQPVEPCFTQIQEMVVAKCKKTGTHQPEYKLMNERFLSTDFARGCFSPHGATEYAYASGRVNSLLVGPLNLEAIEANNRARDAYFTAHPPTQPYVVLTLCQKSLLITSDGLLAQREHLQSFVEKFPAPAAVAWVADGFVEGFELLGAVHAQSFAAAGILMRLFNARAEAESWLDTMLP